MKPRLLILPVAATVIIALVVWRYNRESQRPSMPAPDKARQMAPRFELYDQHSRLVKFERYLGRTEILVVFFDGEVAADKNPLLIRLRDNHDALVSAGLEVIAISLATPHAIREAERRTGRAFPFPVLTDIDLRTPVPAPVHRLWGLADDDSMEIGNGLFFVDRRGQVDWENGSPAAMDNLEEFLVLRIGSVSSETGS